MPNTNNDTTTTSCNNDARVAITSTGVVIPYNIGGVSRPTSCQQPPVSICHVSRRRLAVSLHKAVARPRNFRRSSAENRCHAIPRDSSRWKFSSGSLPENSPPRSNVKRHRRSRETRLLRGVIDDRGWSSNFDASEIDGWKVTTSRLDYVRLT